MKFEKKILLVLAVLLSAFAEGKLKPYDYEVEWLESDRRQVINTGFNPDDSCGFRMRAMPYTNSGNYIPVGCRENASNSRWWANFSAGIEISWNTYESYLAGYNAYAEYIVENNWKGSRLGSINGVVYRTRYDTLANITRPATLFCANNQGAYSYHFQGRIYSCEFSRGENVEMSFVPVVKNGEGMMYDRVSGKLFRNAGTGAFVVGPRKADSAVEIAMGEMEVRE